MSYEEEAAKFGKKGSNEYRNHRKNWLIKGFNTDEDTYLHSIRKLYWATNKDQMVHLTDFKAECTDSLDHHNGRCHCQRHTWLRGNRFSPTSISNAYIFLWEESFCGLMSGYFSTQCEDIQLAGRDRDT